MYYPCNESQYNKIKSEAKGLVIVNFSAKWCGPCKQFLPKLRKYINEYTDITFIHVDIDELDNISDNSDVTKVPTFKFFRNGKLLHRFSGTDENNLKSSIENYR